jgi:hypothetical protein
MNIKLNFINQAQLAPADLPTVLLFQKQVEDGQEYALVWRVIRNCRYMHFHPLTFSTDLDVSMGDEYGNYSALLAAHHGDRFDALAAHGARRKLHLEPACTGGDGIVIANKLDADAFHACLFVRGQLLARRPALPPGGEVNFAADGTLWVGIARRSAEDQLSGPSLPGAPRQWREGSPVTQAVLAAATPIALAGLAVANIVMHGSSAGLSFRCEGAVAA